MLEAGTEMMLSEEVLVSWERRRGGESEGRTVSAENLPEAVATSRAPPGSRDIVFYLQVESIFEINMQA